MPGQTERQRATATPREQKYVMEFLDRNAGPEGFHYPGDQHEVPESRAESLALDGVAVYVDAGRQEAVQDRLDQAQAVNDRRKALGFNALPTHLALRPGAETADWRPGQPVGADPLAPADWRELEKVVERLKAQEAAGKGPAGHGHGRTGADPVKGPSAEVEALKIPPGNPPAGMEMVPGGPEPKKGR